MDHRPRHTDSSEPLPCRLFFDPPADGAWNMAVDEALLEQAADEGLASLRFYQWSEPTLSLGYFQRYAEREQHAASRDAAVVRRLSGGGALLHDRELTYSLCLPASHAWARNAAGLYQLVHSELIAVLAQLGCAARLYGSDVTASASEAPTPEPLLCFARRTPDDVVFATEASVLKIAGSAQRRRRGAVLQHGAVLLDASPFAPELPGVDQLAGPSPTPAQIAGPWSERLARRLHLHMAASQLGAELTLQVRKRLATKHASHTWIKRR